MASVLLVLVFLTRLVLTAMTFGLVCWFVLSYTENSSHFSKIPAKKKKKKEQLLSAFGGLKVPRQKRNMSYKLTKSTKFYQLLTKTQHFPNSPSFCIPGSQREGVGKNSGFPCPELDDLLTFLKVFSSLTSGECDASLFPLNTRDYREKLRAQILGTRRRVNNSPQDILFASLNCPEHFSFTQRRTHPFQRKEHFRHITSAHDEHRAGATPTSGHYRRSEMEYFQVIATEKDVGPGFQKSPHNA